MLRGIIRVVDVLELFGPLLARHHLWLSAQERIVVQVHLGRVNEINEC